MGVKRLCVLTDKRVVKLESVKTVLDSLHHNGVPYDLFDNVRVEPTDKR